MSDSEHEKKLHSERAAEEIRAEEFVRITQAEADRNQNDRLMDGAPQNSRRRSSRKLPKGIYWGVAAIIVIFVGGSLFSWYVVRTHIDQAVAENSATLRAGLEDLQNFDPHSAAQQFSSLQTAPSFGGFLGGILSLFQNTRGTMQAFGDLSTQLVVLSNGLGNLQGDFFTLFSGTSTSPFIADLNGIRTSLAAIDQDTSQLSGAAALLSSNSSIGESYITLKAQAEGAETFLNAFVPWFSGTTPHHVLVLLENPSEMRPGGGFLGSYADVVIQNGAIATSSVHDIATMDSTFTGKIIPPLPLQIEETGFRPADTNWFFNFPTSGAEAIAYAQSSTRYAASGTTFDGVVAVTPNVLSDLLTLTGPITLPKAETANQITTFTSSTLVVKLQDIVQIGQARKDPNAKSVIESLAQAIFQSLASSTPEVHSQLLGMALNWISNKDVMFYFKDPAFQNFVNAYGASGAEYELPQNFNGDYLAITNTDINSDKSELYIDQHVAFEASINPDGSVDDSVAVTRTHHGNQSPYWWYRTTNTDYVQVYAPPGSALTNESGNIVKNVPAPINYGRNGYSTDPFVAAEQSSTLPVFGYPGVWGRMDADGKEVFSTWMRTAAGTTGNLAMNYSHRLNAPPSDGMQYQFILEKPSGATGSYSITINAPLGYDFAETGLSTFRYQSNDPPGRTIISLTLEKLSSSSASGAMTPSSTRTGS